MATPGSPKKTAKRQTGNTRNPNTKTTGKSTKSSTSRSKSSRREESNEQARRATASPKAPVLNQDRRTEEGRYREDNEDRRDRRQTSDYRGQSGRTNEQSPNENYRRQSSTSYNRPNRWDDRDFRGDRRDGRYHPSDYDQRHNPREYNQDGRSGYEGRGAGYRGGYSDHQSFRSTSDFSRNDRRHEHNQGRDGMDYQQQFSGGQSNQFSRDQNNRYDDNRGRSRYQTARSYAQSRPSGDQEEGLRTLLHDQLKDMYWAEKALVKALPKMIKETFSDELHELLSMHLDETEEQVKKLQEIFQLLGQKATGKKCEAMEGLIAEATEIMSDLETGSVKDAGIICAAQKVEHYEIATYGCLKTYAEILDELEVAEILDEILKEEKDADAALTDVAYSINWQAANEIDSEVDEEEEVDQEEDDDEDIDEDEDQEEDADDENDVKGQDNADVSAAKKGQTDSKAKTSNKQAST